MECLLVYTLDGKVTLSEDGKSICSINVLQYTRDDQQAEFAPVDRNKMNVPGLLIARVIMLAK